MGVDPKFAELMVTLAEAYPSVKLREGTVTMYAAELGDLPLAVVDRAMRQAVRESEWFPTIATIRRYANGSADDRALLAWNALGKAATAFGSWASLEIEDSLAATALRSTFGSWPAFCEMEDGPALALKRQEFLAAYRAAARASHTVPTRYGHVPGVCEIQNRAAGQEAPERWIGVISSQGIMKTSTRETIAKRLEK